MRIKLAGIFSSPSHISVETQWVCGLFVDLESPLLLLTNHPLGVHLIFRGQVQLNWQAVQSDLCLDHSRKKSVMMVGLTDLCLDHSRKKSVMMVGLTQMGFWGKGQGAEALASVHRPVWLSFSILILKTRPQLLQDKLLLPGTSCNTNKDFLSLMESFKQLQLSWIRLHLMLLFGSAWRQLRGKMN